MIFTVSTQDKKDIVKRRENVIAAVRAGKLMTLMLETASICNLSCSFCGIHSGRLDRKDKGKGVMRLDLYQQILDEIDNLDFRFETVFFHGFGEPLLNKNIVEMISMAVERKIARKYSIFTNGTLMKPGLFDRLMSSGINEINVSLDTINPAIYKKFKGKDLLDDLLKNIDYGIKRVSQSPIISLVIKCCSGGNAYGLDDENIHQIINKYKAVATDSQHIHIKRIPLVELVDGISKQKREHHEPCEQIFYMAFITYDGRVSPCCGDRINALNIGRIGIDQSLKDILRCQQLRKIREIHLSGNLDQIPICKYCGNRTVVDLSDYRDELLALI